MASTLNVRVFKWDSAKLSINIKPGDYEISMKFDRVILIRFQTEVAVVPCSILDMMHSSVIESFLTKIIKHLPFLGSFDDIDDLACDMICELSLKFGGKELWFNDPNRALVIFFDVKSNNDPRICLPDKKEVVYRVENVCSRRTAIISTHKGDAEMKLDKVEEIEEYLKKCPELTVIGGLRGMKEVKGSVAINVLSGSEEDGPDCPICLERIDVADRYATTNCSHSFHRDCLHKWILLCKHSCPMCRSEFQVSV